MRRLELSLLIAALAIGCASTPRTHDAGPEPQDDAGPTADAGTDSGSVDPDGGPVDPDGGPGCVDADEDGYGEGCAPGPDCDDTNGAVSPAATETCNGVDDDCDEASDEELTAPSCALTEGVCAGAVASCGGAVGFGECGAAEYGEGYEADETLCDGEDNDCDGTTDEGCTCTEGATQACGADVGACMAGTQTCTEGAWGACAGEVGPMGEVCDGEDNDCDGTSDDAGDLTAPACALTQGVCAGSTRSCGGLAGWVACSGIASYGGDYQAVESLCDGLDNDCDGVPDEGCTCIDGTTQACGTDVGACMAGTQTCTAGTFGACAGEVASAPETCDGTDESCDGMTDEGLVGPPCALTLGVCAGSRQPCGGAAGFTACTAADYGPTYQATESSCDGLDNDCDGTPDEGCTCTDGATQDCGVSTGACERGTQTCAAGEWGACTGGVEAAAELCNGLDDDCDGSSDNALTAPACALALGVCAGTVQICGGTSGWAACDASTYGPLYLATEDGATNDAACDGLDNDCDGTPDEGCTGGPLVSAADDEILPSLYHRHLAYLRNYDGNWDVAFTSLLTGETRRLTTTTANEGGPRIYGNHVAFIRGEGAAARAVIYDLTDDTETVISTTQTASVDIAGGAAVFEAHDGTSWELYLHDIVTGTTGGVFMTPTAANEGAPSLRGSRLAYVTDASGTLTTTIIDYGVDPPTVTTQVPAGTSAQGQLGPIMDYAVVGWSDGRYVTSTAAPVPTDDFDVFASFFDATGALGPEGVVVGATGGQFLRDIDGAMFAWDDFRAGNWNAAVLDRSGAEIILSTHPATQADPTLSGNLVVWEDNRLGAYDLYSRTLPVTATPAAGEIVIAEILADPAAGADVNGDGTASTSQDELIELVNLRAEALDISGLTLSDGVSVRHTFPTGTVLPALGSIVVFGGGSIGATALFGGARATPASSGQLGLNNDADTITLSSGATVIDTVAYSGGVASGDQSIVPDPTGAAAWVRHSTVTGSIGAQSPGTTIDGFGY